MLPGMILFRCLWLAQRFVTVTIMRRTRFWETRLECAFCRSASEARFPLSKNVWQDFEALTPNLLAHTIETVSGGGLIVLLLLSNLQSLTQLYSLTMDIHSRFKTESFNTVTGYIKFTHHHVGD